MHLNIRSLLPKFQLFEDDFLDGSVDMVCLTESWLKKGISDSLVCNLNYNLIRHDRTTLNPVTGVCKTGGGIVIYLKKGITYEVCDVDLICTYDIELSVVKLTINGNKKQLLITAYRPPSGNPSRGIEKLISCLKKFNNKYNSSEFVIMGDLNINYSDKRCKHVKLLKVLEKQFGLNQLIKEPTRVTDQKTTIDLCLTNMENISHSCTLCYFLSDHFLIFVVKKKQKLEKKSCNFIGRSFVNYSLEGLNNQLVLIDWHKLLSENNPKIMWDRIFFSRRLTIFVH